MATVYDIKINCTSSWTNYSPKQVEIEIINFLRNKNGLDMESIDVNVIRDGRHEIDANINNDNSFIEPIFKEKENFIKRNLKRIFGFD